MYCTRKVNDGVCFNCYLLRDEKTVLFGTTDAAVRRTFRENLLHALEGRPLDCVVVHHMEPDHTAELEELVLRFPEVQIYCSAMVRMSQPKFVRIISH